MRAHWIQTAAFATTAWLGLGASSAVAATIFLGNASAGVNAREDAGFGYDLSTSDSRIAIGEPGGLSASAPTVIGGAVEIWRREGATALREQRIVAPQPTASGGFGAVVRMSGDWLAIASFDPPALELYRRSGSTWQHRQTIETQTPGPGRMPWLVDLDGDWLVVATFASGVIESPLQAYRRSGDAWAIDQPISGLDILPGEQFGVVGALGRHGWRPAPRGRRAVAQRRARRGLRVRP